MGAVAVAEAGGLKPSAGHVRPKLVFVFTLLIYLSVGPCLAIPRTASTPFEMTIVPFIGNYGKTAQFTYSFVFFGIALYMALNPEKLSDRLGKVLCPILLYLVSIIFIRSFFAGTFQHGTSIEPCTSHSLIQGFLDGYQTMDTITALNLGIIIALNIQSKGIHDSKTTVSSTTKTGLIAGFYLTLAYCALLHVGGLAGDINGYHSNSARTLMQFVEYLFKNTGVIILGAAFSIACLNTCIGLIYCYSEYFCEIIPQISYRKWAFLFVGLGTITSDIGLDMILQVSVPVLDFLYPLPIVLIVLVFLHPWIHKYTYVYQITMLLIGTGSILGLLPSLELNYQRSHSVPLYNQSLGWIIFSAVGLCLNIYVSTQKE